MVADDRRVVAVLLGGRGVGATGPIQAQQRDLDLFGAGIDVQDASSEPDAALEMPGFDVAGHGTLDNFQE